MSDIPRLTLSLKLTKFLFLLYSLYSLKTNRYETSSKLFNSEIRVMNFKIISVELDYLLGCELLRRVRIVIFSVRNRISITFVFGSVSGTPRV